MSALSIHKPADPPSDALTLTPDDVARRLRVGRPAARRLMDAGAIRSADVGSGKRRHRRTSERWLSEYLTGRRD